MLLRVRGEREMQIPSLSLCYVSAHRESWATTEELKEGRKIKPGCFVREGRNLGAC